MAKNKHLTDADRLQIEILLKQRCPLKKIAVQLGKSTFTISREVQRRARESDKFAVHYPHNRCAKRRECKRVQLCEDKPTCTRRCSLCSRCNKLCPAFEKEVCYKLYDGTGYIHSIEATAANVHDITEAAKLIRPDDEVVYGDAGYLGLNKRPEILEDAHKSQIDYRIAQRPGKKRSMAHGPARDWYCRIEYQKASVRAKVEHAFQIIKNTFGFSKVSYRGISKNLNRLYMLAASANLLMCARSGGWRHRPV